MTASNLARVPRTDFQNIDVLDSGSNQRKDFCATCAFANVCALAGYGRPELSELHYVVEHLGPFRRGQRIFRRNDPFRALFTVRSGLVKTMRADVEGNEDVPSFVLPGEVVGLHAIYANRYPCDAIAIQPTQVCRFSFEGLTTLARCQPIVQDHLFRILSRAVRASGWLRNSGDRPVNERIAAFLLDLSARYAARGLPHASLHLGMTYIDIANHLHTAPETISRALHFFGAQRWIERSGHTITFLDSVALQQFADPVMGRLPAETLE